MNKRRHQWRKKSSFPVQERSSNPIKQKMRAKWKLFQSELQVQEEQQNKMVFLKKQMEFKYKNPAWKFTGI